MMSTGEDEPSSGLNGRLRPRKNTIPNPQTTKNIRKPEPKPAQDKPKRTTTPSKVSPNKLDDLNDKSDSPALQILCPYCENSFLSKQAISKHIRNIHNLSSKQNAVINCLFCNHTATDTNDIIRHMVDNHPNQYFACCDCNTRFSSTTELAEHKQNVCENPKLPYRNKLRQKTTSKSQTSRNIHDKEFENDDKKYSEHAFNGIVISCELKPTHPHDPIDIEDNITTNLILPPGKSLSNVNVIEKNAIIVLDDLQWNKRIPPNFSFHNTDADQILSRLGVVHRSPRTGENNRKDWLKNIDDSNQKFEKCFDTSFYSKVASNVQENLTKFLDGSFNFNPDPENTIKTRKAKNSVAINTVEGFPILLASEQFSRNVFDGYLPRTIAPKHKWKWDNLESDKNLMSLEQIKRDSHTNNCIITLVSNLDIWTQLCMRRKFEEKFTTSPLEKRIEKQCIIGQELKEILESRELPTSSSQVVNYSVQTLQTRCSSDFPASLGLVPNPPNIDLKPAVLSGEWVRPRCYVCCACGAQTSDSRALSTHISTHHPNAQIQNYEIVGEVLLNSDILKHLYVPPSQLNNRTRPLRGFRDCTKCRKGISLEDLHQHMLDCAGDTPTVRRKCRYRPFGVRKRRPRLPDNTIRQEMRKDIRHPRHNRKTHIMRPRPKIRTEVGDAETIRKMLADLPAKRHRAIVNPLNPILRPRRKLNKQRSKLVIKKRAIDEVIKKQKSCDFPQPSDSNNENRQKTASNLIEPDNKQKPSHKKPLNKKNVMNKIRKKTFVTKVKKTGGTDEITECKDLPVQPLESEHNKQIDQMSLNSNSERININDGSYNTRQHGNNSSGSNNRDDQNPGSSGQNNSSRDSFSPPQHVPLKHSIASLTASSETQDKSVQFHHLFLVQQECNNANQHLPSGQRMLFENEAVVTKLDKPPLHFNHPEPLDPQGFQRNKLNKPRKGLNDCIAMLRNKLVEPNSTTLPGHVSVQCGSDEPLGPEPVMIERRHSTSDSIVETAQRSMQIGYPNKTMVDTPSSYDMTSRVTRRSSTRHGHSSRRERIVDIQPNNDFMYWNQFYYNQQSMLPGNKSSPRYNKRESNRRKSVVSTEELLLQHAMNMEIMAKSNRSLQNITDYQFANISTAIPTSHKTPRNNRQNGTKTRSTANSITKSKNKATPRTRPKKIIDLNSRQNNSHQKISNVDTQTNNKHNDSHFNRSTVISSITPTTCPSSTYVPGRSEDETNELGVDKTPIQSNVLPEKQLCSNVCQNVPVMQYANDYEIHPVHYNMHIDSTPTAPLDLSHRTTIVEDSRLYITEEPYREVTYDSYVTLDLSQQNMNYVVPEKEMSVSNDQVVDLRVNNNSHLLLSHSTASISDVRNNNLEENASDYSCGHQDRWVFEPEECLPTDLSMRRKDSSTDSFERRRLDTHENISEINMIEDLSHSTNHVNDMYTVGPQREDPDIEEPTDLSIRRNESRSNIPNVSIAQGQHIHLNVCSNNMSEQLDYHDEEIPADLTRLNNESIHNYYLDEQRMPHYVETMVSNNNEIEPYGARSPQRHLNSMDSEQHISAHYDIAQIPLPPEPRTIITYSEPLLNQTQNISNADLVSESSVPCNAPTSINCSSINEYSHHNDVTYLITDMPLHLSNNIANETKICTLMRRESVPRNYDENITSNCRLIQFQEAEPSSTNTNASIRVNTSQGYSPVSKTIVFCKSSSPMGHKSNIIDNRKLSCETKAFDVTSLSTENNTVPLYIVDMEVLKDNYNDSDQNPKTGSKVSILPTELVAILGTMPTDHRVELINVLPQYVSTPPVPSQNNEDMQCDSISLSADSATPPCNSNKLENDYKTSENIRLLPNQTSSSQILQFVERSPMVISSSILLTPPTPKLSDRNYNKSHKNYEVKSIEYRRESRISTDEQIYYKSINSEMSSGSHTKTFHDYECQDRIIDLTVDEFSSETADVSESQSNLARTSKDISIVNPKSNVLRTNSDKTASLRAVRIKTSSERQRTVLTESILTKKHVDSNSILAEEFQNKCSDINIAMTIQPEEISSTLYCPAIKAAAVPVSVLCPEERILNNLQIPTDKNTDANKDNVNYSLPGKQNVVTSPFLKVTHCNFRDEIITKDNMIHPPNNSSTELSLSLNAIDKRSSKHTKKDDGLQSKQLDGFLKDKNSTEAESLVSTGLKNKSTVQSDDSEDDVTLAVIVQQKQRNLNLSSNEQTLYEKGRTRQSVEISLDKFSSHQQNSGLLTNNKTLCTEIVSLCESQSLNNKVPESCNNINNLECDENQTKEYSLKKICRKDRNIFGNRNFMEQQEQLCNSAEVDSEGDINKDKNVSEIKNTDVINDSVKTKPSPDNTYRVELHYDANVESNKYVREDSNENNIMSTSTDTTYNAIKANGSNGVSQKVVEIIEKYGRSESLENCNKIDESRINERQIQIENQTTEQNNISHNISVVENTFVNKSETDIDETNLTPLRRSRRGKSLFIDSRSILNGDTSNANNITEHRIPLTKKQLIFSKLLQDEENHNKPILTTTTPEKPISKSLSDNKLNHDRHNEFNNYDTNEIKCNKRKKSPQSEKRLTKKIFLTSTLKTSDEPVKEVNKELKNLEPNNKPPDKRSTILVTSHLNNNPVSTENTTATDTTSYKDEFHSTNLTKKSIEKRKSYSPIRDELVSSKPKKPKLNNEEVVVSHIDHKKDIDISANEKKIKISKDTLPTTVATRNTTCYNKAIRRARSKSVGIKSSRTELYDPYDIDKIEDLEDTIDKTEPFVRLDVSPKVRFMTSKSATANKTRKLSKTAPSAIINILPSDAKAPVDDIDDDLDKMNVTTTEYNNNSSADTKDNSSDSDASLKSDVPLKKYAEEKEKKLTAVIHMSEQGEKFINAEENGNKQEKSKTRKQHKPTKSINNKDQLNSINKTQNEEDLRSEQFMESFGFFSERKPRKSNLLATKKISETFNIENDEMYFASQERVTKKSVSDIKEEDQALSLRKTKCSISSSKKPTKRGRKKKEEVIEEVPKSSFCDLCQKVFRRWDNYVRHTLSLYHISRVCDSELKVKTVLIEEEPNYLLAFRQQMNRLKILQNKIAKRKENCLSTADIILPTMDEILAYVNQTIRKQQLSRRSLSRDEALFIDCCEMLKESHKDQGAPVQRVRQCNSFNCAQACQEELELLENSISDDRCAIRSDEDMDPLTAKTILESEEVRNLENDLISNLKDSKRFKGTENELESSVNVTSTTESQNMLSNYEASEESNKCQSTIQYKPPIEVKDKLYPDVTDNIDMFEDKFDKIKRKCRSQAAAAKQMQTRVEVNSSYKNRKKYEKKKVNNRKVQNVVPTKAALKGFDGIKVSIQTSDINISAIVPSVEKIPRKRKKIGSKKKRERKNSEKSSHRESNNSTKEVLQKKLDVYEFMDTEDTEVFEFRPSTLMERLKSINNNGVPSTSKATEAELGEISSESGSDGDDFVYMSDDYVGSDDETENSMFSCELENGKGINEHNKTTSLIKKKEVTEKNAVMGKIFKHNAVRTEKKNPKVKEIVKPKANLDQLFDSLLENEPMTSSVTNDEVSNEKDEIPPSRVYLSLSPQKEDQSRYKKSFSSFSSETGLTQKYSTPSPTLHPSLASFSTRRKSITPPRKLESNTCSVSTLDDQSSTSKPNDDDKKNEISKELPISKEIYEPLLSCTKSITATNTDDTQRRQSNDFSYEKHKSKDLFYKHKSDKKKKETLKYDGYDCDVESLNHIMSEDAGVARQRARRKCTVGKQNVLAETWSSESETDNDPPRPNSAESVVAGSGRKKKGRKKDGQSSSNRKASRLVSVKKHENKSRVDSSNRNSESGMQSRPRSPYYWSEGNDEQEHPQQHGWIVGDSHKKLVTMLAHAKGRKRSGDEKRHLLE